MADQPPVRESADDGTPERLPDPSAPHSATPRSAEATIGTPRWVKVFGIIGVIRVLLIIGMLFTGHGPGRHMHSGLRIHTPSTGIVLGRTPAFDGHRA